MMKPAPAPRWEAPDEKLDRLYQLIEDIEVATDGDVAEPIARCFARRAARHGRR